MYFLIINMNTFGGDLSDISAETATLIASAGLWWRCRVEWSEDPPLRRIFMRPGSVLLLAGSTKGTSILPTLSCRCMFGADPQYLLHRAVRLPDLDHSKWSYIRRCSQPRSDHFCRWHLLGWSRSRFESGVSDKNSALLGQCAYVRSVPAAAGSRCLEGFNARLKRAVDEPGVVNCRPFSSFFSQCQVLQRSEKIQERLKKRLEKRKHLGRKPHEGDKLKQTWGEATN